MTGCIGCMLGLYWCYIGKMALGDFAMLEKMMEMTIFGGWVKV